MQISIKGSSIYGNISKDFQVRLNKQGICERDQLLSELSPVLSVNAATRECLRTGCDYFTMATLEGFVAFSARTTSRRIEGIPGTVNKAWFCSGSPKTVDSDGFITAVRKRRNNEL
ncbi:uncharacterized protein BcabD6B2_25000 [Babesia caballi]|uniref:Uncharacterized protein n=1 Tax=Babesia caballi TaxID=5871 RepID=A0AAV4LTI2_BABCB|nr:hypothetical protein BcabD6B2_25000 [Babesia caballi]